MKLAVLLLLGLAALVSGQQRNYYEQFQSEEEPLPPRNVPVRAVSPSSSRINSAAPRPTPVPILKQINRHNEDGSYTYGYEAADGSFKIETKAANGEVKGKYGYVDDTGDLRVIEYGADKLGFQPSGKGITVPPPTLVDETEYEDELRHRPRQNRPQQNGPAFRFQTSEDPIAPRAPVPVRQPAPRPQRPVQQQQQQPQYIDASQFEQQVNYGGQQQYQPQHSAPRAGPQPTAPRARPQLQFAGAVPDTRSAPRPAPQQFQQPRPAPPQQYERPVARQAAPARQGGFLDQLAKEYALPQGSGTALHDISFGYY